MYVRIPTDAAEKLDRAAFESKRSKQDLVADLVAKHLEPGELELGHAALRPAPRPPDVMTVAEVAAWLQVDEAAVTELAEAGELPGRNVAGRWRFAREAVLAWLAGT